MRRVIDSTSLVGHASAGCWHTHTHTHRCTNTLHNRPLARRDQRKSANKGVNYNIGQNSIKWDSWHFIKRARVIFLHPASISAIMSCFTLYVVSNRFGLIPALPQGHFIYIYCLILVNKTFICLHLEDVQVLEDVRLDLKLFESHIKFSQSLLHLSLMLSSLTSSFRITIDFLSLQTWMADENIL